MPSRQIRNSKFSIATFDDECQLIQRVSNSSSLMNQDELQSQLIEDHHIALLQKIFAYTSKSY
jgi:hypothetical protein